MSLIKRRKQKFLLPTTHVLMRTLRIGFHAPNKSCMQHTYLPYYLALKTFRLPGRLSRSEGLI